MIDFIHRTHARSRSLKLKIEANGELVVITPPRYPVSRIESFVHEHLPWIIKTRTKMHHRQKQTHNPHMITVFGKDYAKRIVCSRQLKVGMHIKGTELIINTIKGTEGNPSLTDAEHQLERFLKQTAEKYIVPRTHQIAQRMQVSFGRISLRNQKTRWGSCSSRGNLNFNWKLVHYAPEIIDYVIIHELAHRREMNHSHRFWQIVRQYDPAFEQHRGWLKRHGWTEA